MKIETVGSVCSGIEAGSVAWEPLGLSFKWFSEIAPFPSSVLASKYPDIPNLGDMNDISQLIKSEKVAYPDMICGGTPCQAFSLAGWKNGLNDDRGNLTLRFVDIIEANDKKRLEKGLPRTVVFWENVEGVLTDKTNAFGCFISLLAGIDSVVEETRWPSSGIVYGKTRNIAWRVLDAKYFGVPQQRRRLYVIAGGKGFHPENILFEENTHQLEDTPPSYPLTFTKDGHEFEVFREYTDCLYAAYGTKWNGNAAATNGSLFVVQDKRIRRLSPLECERLMGFPDGYTEMPNAKKTNRYQATGNSWSVPVVRWLGNRLINNDENSKIEMALKQSWIFSQSKNLEFEYFPLGKDVCDLGFDYRLNCTPVPEQPVFGSMFDIVSANASEDIYISPVGCYGIIRRKEERNTNINARLEEILLSISSQMSADEIEKRSKIQKRGIPSRHHSTVKNSQKQPVF